MSIKNKKKFNYKIIFISYLCLIIFGLLDNMRGPIFPELIKEFNLSSSHSSLYFTFASLFSFLIVLSSIYLVKYFSKKKLLLISSLGISLIYFLAIYYNSFNLFLTQSIFYGIFAGIIGLIPNVMIPSSVDEKYRQQVLSGLHSMYGLASLVAPLLTAFIFNKTHHFKMVFFYFSFFPLLLFLITLFIDFSEEVEVEVDQDAHSKINLKDIFDFKVISMSLILSLAVLIEVLISSRLSLLLKEKYHFSFEKSSYYLGLFFVLMLIGRLTFAFVKLRFKLIYQVIFLEFLICLLIYLGLNVNPLYIVLTGLFVAPLYPFVATILAHRFLKKIDIVMSFAVALNSGLLAIMHFSFGKVSESFGLESAFSMCFLFVALTLLLFGVEYLISNKNTSK